MAKEAGNVKFSWQTDSWTDDWQTNKKIPMYRFFFERVKQKDCSLTLGTFTRVVKVQDFYIKKKIWGKSENRWFTIQVVDNGIYRQFVSILDNLFSHFTLTIPTIIIGLCALLRSLFKCYHPLKVIAMW